MISEVVQGSRVTDNSVFFATTTSTNSPRVASRRQHESATFKSFLSGASSGVVMCVLFQPMDLVKTRLQVSPSLLANLSVSKGDAGVTMIKGHTSAGMLSRNCIIDTIMNVIRSDSYTGLWRGLAPSLCRTVPGVGMYFCTLNVMKDSIGGNPTLLQNMAFGFTARSLVGTVMLPITVIKTRYESGCFNYSTVPQALHNVWKLEGMRGLFSGWKATIARDAPYSGLYYMFYSQQKTLMTSVYDRDLTVGDNFLCGIIAGVLACAVTQPADVVKTQMQLNSSRYRGVFDCLLVVLKGKNGVSGLVRGFAPRCLRKSLMSAFSWTLFEEIMKLNIRIIK